MGEQPAHFHSNFLTKATLYAFLFLLKKVATCTVGHTFGGVEELRPRSGGLLAFPCVRVGACVCSYARHVG